MVENKIKCIIKWSHKLCYIGHEWAEDMQVIVSDIAAFIK